MKNHSEHFAGQNRPRILAFSAIEVANVLGINESLFKDYYRRLSNFASLVLITIVVESEPEMKITHSPEFIEHRVRTPPTKAATSRGHNVEIAAVAHHDGRICSMLDVGLNDIVRLYCEHYDTSDIILHDSPFTILMDCMFGLDRKMRIYLCTGAYYVDSAARFSDSDPSVFEIVKRCERLMVNASHIITYINETQKGHVVKLLDISEPHFIKF
jgi:hypothetical protein